VAKNRLGKGLGALLPEEHEAPEVRETPARGGGLGEEILLPLDRLSANPEQPRRNFDRAELEELAASIKQHGIIQPIIVDEGEGGGFVIVAGERRSRAARMAGLTEVPALVRKYSGQKRLEIALIENIHRADLNPIEEASAYRQIMENGGLSQDETAERVGKNRSTVANALRLLKLPPAMRRALEEGSLSAGHARAILSLAGAAAQERLFAEIRSRGLSVREAEKLAAELGAGAKASGQDRTGPKRPDARDPQLKAMEEKCIETLGTKVRIDGTLTKGRVEIEYYSMEDLDRLYGLLSTAVPGAKV
jgi:ParB family chromosome partitioning protein